MQKKQNPVIRVLENITLVMILLVLIQTFLEDFSFYMGWPINGVNKIKLSAVIFDLYFTIEFITRLISNITKKRAVDYLVYKNGWIDGLSSIPLLLLLSLPEFMFQVFDIDFMSFGFINQIGLLKVIKAIRVTRILRMLRVLKIFGKIKNVSSSSAQRHVTVISTITISAIILFLICASILTETGVLPGRYNKMIRDEENINSLFKKIYAHTDSSDMESILKLGAVKFQNILAVIYNDDFIYESKHMNEDYYRYYKKINDKEMIESYEILSGGKLVVMFYRLDYYKKESLQNLINLLLIVVVLLSLVFIYTRYFALSISDPIYVMRMGFEKRDYTYAVKIQKHFEDDDVFLLARDYNARWLPAKIKKLSELSTKKSKLSFDDVFKQ